MSEQDTTEAATEEPEVEEPEEEIEEISTSGGAAGSVGSIHGYSSPFGAKRRKRKKVSEKEVNEALNYLLQKLGV